MSEALKITEPEAIPVDELPVPKGYRILIRMAEPKRQTAGGIILADTSIEAEQYMMYLGKVEAMGELCYHHKKFENGDPWCQVGDWIAFGQHAGQILEMKGQRFKLINDDNVMAVIPKPEIMKVYV